MLILTRRPRQAIFIGDDVSVTIPSVQRSNVRIGINAPKNVPVHREEIWLRLQEEEKQGASTRIREPIRRAPQCQRQAALTPSLR